MSVLLAVVLQAWVLDTLPGDVRAGEPGRKDHPADLIAALRRLPLPVADRNSVMDYLTQLGGCWAMQSAKASPASRPARQDVHGDCCEAAVRMPRHPQVATHTACLAVAIISQYGRPANV